jgi:hypothetical protein
MVSQRSVLVLAFAISLFSSTAAAALPASPDPSMPSTVTTTDGNSAGFAVFEDVAYDPASGPWLLELRNAGSGISSGDAVPLSLTLTNTGSIAWTEWHQAVASTTVTSSGVTIPGFLFVADSLVVARNGTPLIEGVDYTLTPTAHTATDGPPGGTNFGHWEGVSIVFSASGEIAPGQTLTIEQQIFEVFLDGDPWRPDDVAVIQQHPSVPEPRTWGMLALAVALLLPAVAERAPDRSRAERIRSR